MTLINIEIIKQIIVIELIGGPIDKNAEYILGENKDIELLNKTSFLVSVI